MEWKEWIESIIQSKQELIDLKRKVMEAIQNNSLEELKELFEKTINTINAAEKIPQKQRKKTLADLFVHLGLSLILTPTLSSVEDVFGLFPAINCDLHYQGRDTVRSFLMLYCLYQTFCDPYPELAGKMERVMKDIYELIKPCIEGQDIIAVL